MVRRRPIKRLLQLRDRHVPGRKNRVAIKWEGHLGETRTYTYQDLYREVNEFAAALRDRGVGPDDVVTLYLPMVPELPVAMLACARLGVPHNVVFAGFSADALATRMERAESAFSSPATATTAAVAPSHGRARPMTRESLSTTTCRSSCCRLGGDLH